MKRQARICWLSAVLLALALLGGCAAEADPAGENGLFSEEPEYVTEWPDNQFTACIPEPAAGEVDYVRDGTDTGRYEIVMKEISREESAAYVEELLAQGYEELAADSNEVSAGVLLEKEDVMLSIACSDGVLNILITLDSAR